MYELIVFDLDNTLAISKTVVDEEMSELISKLLIDKKVAVISGGNFKQFEKEILFPLKIDTNFSNLHLFPTDGAEYLNWNSKEGKWQKIYQEPLTEKSKIRIKDAFSKVLSDIHFDTKNISGELIEDRGSSITFSALGQNASLEDKVKWDPDNKKRLEIRDRLVEIIPELEIHVAGTTSIDVTAKGLDKAYGVRKMVEYTKVSIDKMIYVGDSLFPGGNDNPVISTGVRTISVKDPEETKSIIRDIINNKI